MANRIRKLGQLIVLFILINLLGGYVANVKAAERKDIEPLRLRVGYFLPTGQADKSQLRFGYGYDYLKEMAKYTGWEYEFVYASKVRCLEMLENGELDLVGFVVRTPEEEARFAVTALPHGARTLTLLTEINNYEFTEDGELI